MKSLGITSENCLKATVVKATPVAQITSPLSNQRYMWEAFTTLCFLAPVWGCLVFFARHYVLDDSLIYLRYIRNLHDYGELTYNVGERYNGLTSPLFTLLVAGGVLVLNHPVLVVNLMCGTLLLASAVVLHVVIASQTTRLMGALGMAFVLFSPYFYQCFGMETSLFMFLAVLCIYLHLHKKLWALACCSGLLVITRWEGGLLVGVMAVHLWRQKYLRWGHLPLMVALIAPWVAVTIFNLAYYGPGLPSTILAKFGQGSSGYWGRWPSAFFRVGNHAAWFWGGKVWLCTSVIGLSMVGMVHLRQSQLSRIVLPFLAIYGAAFVLLNVPNYHWYYAGFYFFGLGYAGVGVGALIQRASCIEGAVVRNVARAATVLMSLVVLSKLATTCWASNRAMRPEPGYRAAADWISSHTSPQATIAASEIGTLGWYSNRPMVDILGLVTPYNAEAIARHDLSTWIDRSHPSYILVHEPPTVFEKATLTAVESGDYKRIAAFPVKKLQLLERQVSR